MLSNTDVKQMLLEYGRRSDVNLLNQEWMRIYENHVLMSYSKSTIYREHLETTNKYNSFDSMVEKNIFNQFVSFLRLGNHHIGLENEFGYGNIHLHIHIYF
jgi:hypothetical protein